MYIQLHGTQGASKYYEFGRNFITAKQGEANIQVQESVGVLRSITLLAGGSGGWNAASSISVESPDKMLYEYKTNVVIGNKPVGAVVSKDGSWEIEKGSSEFEGIRHFQKLQLFAYNAQYKAGQKLGKCNRICKYGDTWTHPGWADHGQDDDKCNTCKCNACTGIMTCTKKSCTLGSLPAGAQKCSHLHCKYHKSAQGRSSMVMVHHHHLEQHGERHSCGYNAFSQTCHCYCYSAAAAPAQILQ